MTKDEDVKF